MKHLKDVMEMDAPMVIDTIDGEATVTRVGDCDDGMIPVKGGVIMQGAQESVIPVHTVVSHRSEGAPRGYGYWQDEDGAAVVNRDTQEVWECPPCGPGGMQYRLPLKYSEPVARQGVQVAEQAVFKERMERKKEESKKVVVVVAVAVARIVMRRAIIVGGGRKRMKEGQEKRNGYVT